MAMMGGDGWGIGGGLMMLLFWGVLIALVVFLIRGFGAPPSQAEKKWSAPDAWEILAQRFARGEISVEEFEQRRRVLDRTRRGASEDEFEQREAKS
jgi:putative membrane protein